MDRTRWLNPSVAQGVDRIALDTVIRRSAARAMCKGSWLAPAGSATGSTPPPGAASWSVGGQMSSSQESVVLEETETAPATMCTGFTAAS